MVFIYHRIKKPSIFDFEHIPKVFRNLIYQAKHKLFPSIDLENLKESDRPIVKTSTIPGPNGVGLLNDIALFSIDYHNRRIFADPRKSYLNFIHDADDNIILDFNISNLPLGYNHPCLIKESQTKNHEIVTANPRMSGSMYISEQDIKLVEYFKQKVGPGVTNNSNRFVPCKNPIEVAYELILKVQNNSEKINILSLGSDLPIPRTQDFHCDKYKEEEASCLKQIKEILEQKASTSACVIINPIVNLNHEGEYFLKSGFIYEISKLVHYTGMNLIVDISKTVYKTGERYSPDELLDADFITFSSDSNVLNSGMITSLKYSSLLNQINDFDLYICGRSLKNFRAIVTEIEKNQLVSKSKESSNYFQNKLNDCLPYYNNSIGNYRGNNTVHLFDLPTHQIRNDLRSHLLNQGVNVGISGNKSIKIETTLLASQKHYDHFITALNNYKF